MPDKHIIWGSEQHRRLSQPTWTDADWEAWNKSIADLTSYGDQLLERATKPGFSDHCRELYASGDGGGGCIGIKDETE